MKPPFKVRKLTPEEEIEWTKSHYEDRFYYLIERFYLTGNLETLKEFVLRGGDIHRYDLGKTIADLIGAKPEPNPGGGKAADMIDFYLEVELLRGSLRPKNRDKAEPTVTRPRKLPEDKTLQEQLLDLKKVPKDDAIEEVSEKCKLSFDGGEYRYKKGKKLFKESFKKG
jgi:hypothetical protein